MPIFRSTKTSERCELSVKCCGTINGGFCLNSAEETMMVSSEHSPSVFLSYARRRPDEDWAGSLVEVLRGRYGVGVFYDKQHITVGREFDREIKRLICASDALVFLGSAASVTSTGCREECVYARDQGKPIIPLFIYHTSWGDFPADFHSLHFEQLHQAKNEDEFVAMIGKGLLAGGLAVVCPK